MSEEIVPLVSIRCLVYNHEPYLRQCLDGLVMQKTNFPFEAIVHDDASIDGSAAIIREYAEKYPEIIKPIFETENQYSKGTIGEIMREAGNPNAKYIAHCEGDDDWMDPEKLQLQVDFLETHPDYFMTCHAFKYYLQDSKTFQDHKFVEGLPLDVFEGREYCTPTIENYFRSEWFTQLLTVVRRNQRYASVEAIRQYKIAYDYITCYYMMKKGKCALFKDVMGVYRKQSGGVFSGANVTEWRELSFTENMTLYQYENEKLAISKINYFFLELFKEYVHKKQYGKAASILMRYVTGLKFNHLAEVVINKIRGKHS